MIFAALISSYIATYHITGADGSYNATAYVRGSNYRIDAVLDGVTYEMGRYDSRYWRRTPAGEVRIIAADVQSDPLDRWPRAPFSGVRLEVPPREVDRDGSHVFTYTFNVNGWTISGYGGDATVVRTAMTQADVSDAQVQIPASNPVQFSLPPSGTAAVSFDGGHAFAVPVQIDGRNDVWNVDSGTTQILIDLQEARRLGLHPKFGHVIIPELRVAGAVAHDIPAQAVDIFGGKISGLLGYEFFTGHIVHVDYNAGRIELIDKARWTPPASTVKFLADFSEGMPLVSSSIDGVTGTRFALDTGSYWILLMHAYAEKIHARRVGMVQRGEFLEGPVWFEAATVPNFAFPGTTFEKAQVKIEDPYPESLQIPLDGIFGNELLAHFEWWYDYDDGAIWVR